MLEPFSSQEWSLMMYDEVKESLCVQNHDYLICPEHKTAEVARSAQKLKAIHIKA